MKTIQLSTQTDDRPEQSAPEPIRVIRQGQWVILASEAEMTAAERRAAYVAMFGIYG